MFARPAQHTKRRRNSMSGKKTSDLTTIKIGSRVRHSSDGVAGKITWANGTVVKIQWDDGEKVTWKRAELASKGLEVLDDATDTQEAVDTPAVETTQAETPKPEQVEPGPA